MYICTLEEAKKHLNIESYFTDDDVYITNLISVSFYSIKNACNNITWVDNSGNTTGSVEFADDNTVDIPLVVKQALLLMVGNLYANREPVSFGGATTIPYTIQYLIEPYINYGGVWTTTTTTTI